jgi:hypothetical protein
MPCSPRPPSLPVRVVSQSHTPFDLSRTRVALLSLGEDTWRLAPEVLLAPARCLARDLTLILASALALTLRWTRWSRLRYNEVLKRNKTTHLVIEFATGNKYDKALKWGTTLVSKEWLEACAQVRLLCVGPRKDMDGTPLFTCESQEGWGGARETRSSQQPTCPVCVLARSRALKQGTWVAMFDELHVGEGTVMTKIHGHDPCVAR